MMIVDLFEEETLWRYTDVYDKAKLLGPVTFPELRELWKLGRIGPGTTVSNEAWLPKPVAVKRVKGLMTALSVKGGTPRNSRLREEDPHATGIEAQLWYCQMPNGEVVGPLKTRTLQRLWVGGKVGSRYLVRAKSSSTWPSDRTYTVEGLMQALEIFTRRPSAVQSEGQQVVPEVPTSLITPTRAAAREDDLPVASPISAIKEVVITLPGHRHGSSSSRRNSSRKVEVEVSTTVEEPESSSSTHSSTLETSSSRTLTTGISTESPSEATSSASALVPFANQRGVPSEATLRRTRTRITSQSQARGGSPARERRRSSHQSLQGGRTKGALEQDSGFTVELERANAEIKRLTHSLAQSEKEKIQAREVALSLRTMLVEERKRMKDKPQISSALPKSPLAQNSAPDQSVELKKLSHMSTDSLFSYANTLRAENEKLLSIRKEIVDAHKSGKGSDAGAGKVEGMRSVTPVPFNMSPSIPVSANANEKEAGQGRAANFGGMPPSSREAYESSTRTVHAESLAGPAYSPFGDGSVAAPAPAPVPDLSHQQHKPRSAHVFSHSRRNSDSGPCECTTHAPDYEADDILAEIEKEIEIFLTPRENSQAQLRRADTVPRYAPSSQEAHGRREVSHGRGGDSGYDFEFAPTSRQEPSPYAHQPSPYVQRGGGAAGSKEWSKETTVNPRYQPSSDKIDEAVKDFVQKFKDDGFHLPLAYAEGFGYMLSGKKVHLACFGKKLHIRFGGGYIEFRDYLDQKKIVLHELARRKDDDDVFR
ncbi:hypothetical protein HOP50_05g38160 [Chloropicon primus]|nr:hypothetical protein HOP50_05g38160 [Chloropicon primus]